MFSLTWFLENGKKLFAWASTVIGLAYLYQILNSYLKSRAVKKSEEQGVHDEKSHDQKVSDAERKWNECS